MGISALLNTLGTRCRTLPLVILYVTEGCNLRCISCSYRSASPGELTLEEIEKLSVTLRASGLRHIVYSGGEPLLRREFPAICSMFGAPEISQTLLTNGLLLEKRLPEIRRFLREIIVSLDGPDEETHDSIRGVRSFAQITKGIRSAVSPGPDVRVTIRTVVQRRNFRTLIPLVRLARDLGVSGISFLAADVRSDGFGRAERGPASPEGTLLPDADEIRDLRALIRRMSGECSGEFSSHFIAESPEKLMRIADYFDALNGSGPFPPTHCNAPMVSTVITSTGDVLPCYFLPPVGNIRKAPLADILNAEGIRSTRNAVRAGTPAPCKTCVCTLNVRPSRALMGRF
jgi:MoaA/NifB/PqqE/SkfB family radical SAM enzyme